MISSLIAFSSCSFSTGVEYSSEEHADMTSEATVRLCFSSICLSAPSEFLEQYKIIRMILLNYGFDWIWSVPYFVMKWKTIELLLELAQEILIPIFCFLLFFLRRWNVVAYWGPDKKSLQIRNSSFKFFSEICVILISLILRIWRRKYKVNKSCWWLFQK